MKIVNTAVLCAFTALALAGCNESNTQDALDVKSSQTAIQKDNAAISAHDKEIAADRAAKATAKAKGDRVTQAKKSVEIGYGKTAKNLKQTERKVDERILEEDKEDLQK